MGNACKTAVARSGYADDAGYDRLGHTAAQKQRRALCKMKGSFSARPIASGFPRDAGAVRITVRAPASVGFVVQIAGKCYPHLAIFLLNVK